MEILKNFGIDPVLLGAQIVNFLIVLFIMRRFFYKPLLQVLQKRQQTVKESIEKAEEARILLEKTSQKEKEILKNAQLEAKKLLEEAKKQREEALRKTEEATKKQAETMLQEARSQIAYETKEVEKRLATHISELTVMFLQKSLSGLFNEKEQEIIIKSALHKMKEKVD